MIRLDEILQQGEEGQHLRVLFPSEQNSSGDAGNAAGGGESVPDAINAALSSPSQATNTTTASLTVLVPDGSWECARALVTEFHRRARKQLQCVSLDPDRVSLQTSPLLEALHPGAGKGRVSTLEACALFLEETCSSSTAELEEEAAAAVDGSVAGACLTARKLRAALTPLVEYCSKQKMQEGGGSNGSGNGSGKSVEHPYSSEWLTAIEAASQQQQAANEQATGTGGKHALPKGLRRCGVCGAALSTHMRMQRHLLGKRHCEAVVRRVLVDAPPTLRPDTSSAAAALHVYSTVPLSKSEVDPPDVALAALSEAFEQLHQPAFVDVEH